jgi:hypothetical protein
MLPLDDSDPGRWGARRWLGWSALVVLGLTVASVASLLIAWGGSTTCNEVATTADVLSGQRQLAVLAGVLLAPWALAATVSRRRWPVFLLGFAITVVPVVLVSLTHTQPRNWVGSFCF